MRGGPFSLPSEDAPIQAARVAFDGPAPISTRFGEGYFAAEDPLGEARAVFLAGCGLPERWRGRRRFVVGELGFGAGRNLAALLDLWARARPPAARLHVFSVEAQPLSREDAARALAPWPELARLAGRLLARWPAPTRGFHRLDFPEIAATVDIAHAEAAQALETWSGRADAWFLDGFSPARNPAMWRPPLLRLVTARSAPGARAASFTAAGQVRRDLAAAGFVVERRPGFGRKRHRLEARLPGEPPPEPAAPRVAILGAGIAGAALARAVFALGAEPRVFASGAPAASAGPAALVAPRLDAGLAAPAALFAQAFARAVDLYGPHPEAILGRGARLFGAGERDLARFKKIAASDLFAPGSLCIAAERPPELWLREALVVEPAVLLAAWLRNVEAARVASIERKGASWRLRDCDGERIIEADVVFVAAGMASGALARLPLLPVRGQASLAQGVAWSEARLFPGGYALPTRAGVLFGATHDRGDDDSAPRQADHARNLSLAQGAPELAAAVAGRPLAAHAGVRATTRDYLPLAGATGDGLFVLGGLGSRGFTVAPLLAEHVAALALGAPSALSADIARLVDPARASLEPGGRQV